MQNRRVRENNEVGRPDHVAKRVVIQPARAQLHVAGRTSKT